MDARIDSRIPVDVREKASKELTAHGLSTSSLIRVALPPAANGGLPKYRDVPSTETMSSISEAIDDLNRRKLRDAFSYSELKKLLDKRSYPNQPF